MAEKKVDSQEEPKNNWTGMVGSMIFVALMAVYTVYTFNPDTFSAYSKRYPLVLKPLEKVFEAIDKYSPFHNVFDDSIHLQSSGKEVVMTKSELSKYDGSKNSPGLYLAVLGQVFDVGNNPDTYGPEGGYHFFTGKDGTRAFVTGQFNEKGLVDDIEGLNPTDYRGLEEWLSFYHKDYKYVGKLVGNFFDSEGKEKPAMDYFRQKLAQSKQQRAELDEERRLYPPCNVQTSSKVGKRVWCTNKSGGIDRNWVGVPRRLFITGKSERCACIRTTGPPANDPNGQTNTGDLESPLVKEYENCEPKAWECIIEKPKEEGKK